MNTALCQYSFSRTLKKNNWKCVDFALAAKNLGVDGIDFHTAYLGCPKEAPQKMRQALDTAGLEMSALSLANNFNKEKMDEFKQQTDYVKEWICVASRIESPVCRIFGGHIVNRSDKNLLDKAFARVLDGLSEAVKEAEKYGIVLVLENHGNLPCTAQEQIDIINKINSKYLRATVDVGNYLQGCQEAHVGTAVAVPYASYVHFKDFKNKKEISKEKPWGWDIEPCAIGEGDVDLAACTEELKKVGYDGFVALEYEGPEDESTAVPRSIERMKNLIGEIEQHYDFPAAAV